MRIEGKPSFGKRIKVILVDDADEAYRELKRIVEEERGEGVQSSKNQTLLGGIERAISLLKSNIGCGKQVPKKQIPKKYVELYEVDNLWRMDLPLYWRLIYTITPSGETEIINLILDIHDHPTYDKVFGYKKR